MQRDDLMPTRSLADATGEMGDDDLEAVVGGAAIPPVTKVPTFGLLDPDGSDDEAPPPPLVLT